MDDSLRGLHALRLPAFPSSGAASLAPLVLPTADHVVVATERLTSEGAYVLSNAYVLHHTGQDAYVVERLPEGNRRAALDVFSEMRANNSSIVNRVRVWKQLSIQLAQRLAAWPNQQSTDGMRIASPQKRLSQSI